MFRADQNRQRKLRVDEALKIHSEAGFKDGEPVSVALFASDKQESLAKFNENFLSKAWQGMVTLEFSREWYDDEFTMLPAIYRSLEQTQCGKGLSLIMDGIDYSKDTFAAVKLIATNNPTLTSVEFREGSNIQFMQQDETTRLIKEITDICTKNKFTLQYPTLKDYFAGNKLNFDLTAEQRAVLAEFDAMKAEEVEVNFSIRK